SRSRSAGPQGAVMSCPLSVDLQQGVGNHRAAAHIMTAGGLNARSIATNEYAQRASGAPRSRPIFGRRPKSGRRNTEGRLRLSGVLSGLAKSRVQPVRVYFEVERALRDSQLSGNHRQVAVAARDRHADGVALNGIEIPSRA